MTAAIFMAIANSFSAETADSIYWFFAIFGSLAFGLSGFLHLLGIGNVSSVPDDVDIDMDGHIDIPHTLQMFPLLGIADYITNHLIDNNCYICF